MILSIVEESRTGQQLLGGLPELTRTFTVTMSEIMSEESLAAACGVLLGSPHPTNPFAIVVDVKVEESRVEDALPDAPADANDEIRKEAQQNTTQPLPPDEILVTNFPVLLAEE